MDAKRANNNLRNSSFIIGGASYKELHEESDNNLINELLSLDNNDQAISIIYRLFLALSMDDYSLSQIVCVIKNTFEDYNKNITKEEILDILKACINASYNELCTMNNQNTQSAIQQPITAPQPQQDQQQNPSEVNMNLGFDIGNFINMQQPAASQQQQYPTMGYVHQQQQNVAEQNHKNNIDMMINAIKNNIDTSENKISFNDIYTTDSIDIMALYWLMNSQEIKFQLANSGVSPQAKFKNIINNNNNFKYKFEIGGRYVYLSTNHYIDGNNNIHFSYRIE